MAYELDDVLNRSFDNCNDADKLREVVKDLQSRHKALQTQIDHHSGDQTAHHKTLDNRERDITARERTLNSRENSFGSLCTSTWVLAERNYPTERTLVLYHDGRNFEIRNASQLEGKQVFISRIPSRWRNTIHVYTQPCGSKSTGSQPRVCITSSKEQPESLRWSRTLHLGKLPIGTKLRLLSGNIEWLFVTQNVSPRPSKVASPCQSL